MIIFVILSFLPFLWYSRFPPMMASHWNYSGKVNHYLPKFTALIMFPLINIFILALYFLIPKVDPLKKNIKSFKLYFGLFMLFMIVFIDYILLLVSLYNLGYWFNLSFAILPALSIFYLFCGLLVQHAKRNWFIGIRTPWTLSSKKVWNKTHRVGSELFYASAIISLFSMIYPSYWFWFSILPVFVFSLFLFFYSYLVFREIKANN